MREKMRKIDQVVRSIGFVRDRIWTDPRGGQSWTLWLETAGDRPALVFGRDGEVHKVVVDFDQGLWGLSNEELQRFLDEAKSRSAKLRGLVAELGLPRPASAEEPGVETLPRTAAEPGPDRGTLPRAAEVGEEDDEELEGPARTSRSGISRKST